MSSITVLSGVDGIKEAYREALKAKKIDIQCLSKQYPQVIGSFFDAEVAPALAQKEVREVTDAGGKLEAVSSESDIMITPEAAYLISFHPDHPQAVIIRDGELVKALSVLFEKSL